MKRLRLRLLATLLLSWALLVWQLDARSLWVDEFLTLETVTRSMPDVIAASIADIHPPLYFLALHGWVAVAGASDFALRWFSVVAALIALALMPALTRRLLDARSVLPSTLVLGVAPAFVEFSRMARYYSLLLVLGMWCTLCLLAAMRHGRWRDWVAYVLASLALLYTFYPSSVMLVAHGLCIVLSSRRRAVITRWLLAVVIIAALFAPWFVVAAGRQVTSIGATGGVDFTRTALGFALGVGASFYTFGIGETLFPWHPIAWLGLALFGVLLLRALAQRVNWQSFGVFLITVALISFVTTYVATGTPFLNVPVRALFALPFFVLTLTAGLRSLGVRAQRSLLVGLLAVWGISVYNDFSGQQVLNPIYLTPSKEAAAFVTARLAPGDLVISDYDSVFGHYFLSPLTTPQHRYTTDAVLLDSQPARIWLVTIGRDQSERFASAETVRQSLASRLRLASVERMLPIDEAYLRLKNFVLRRNTYEYRLTIELYTTP